MTTTTLRLPDADHRAARVAADAAGISLNDWYVSAVRRALGWPTDEAPPPPLSPVEERPIDPGAVATALAASRRAPAGKRRQTATRYDTYVGLGVTLHPDAYETLFRLRAQTGLSRNALIEAGVRVLAYALPEKAPQ